MPIHDEILQLENSLRSIIGDVLRTRYGSEWMTRLGVSEGRVERWTQRRGEAESTSTGAVVEQRLLYYSDFFDLWPIIDHNWDLFQACFGSKRETEVYLSRLNELRNPSAHSRPVLHHEEALAEGMSRELRQKITIFRNTGAGGPEPEHFCRIEEVSDSFGHRTGGRASDSDGFVDTRDNVTLRPGDVVTFAGSAIDPHDRAMRWQISSPFRGSGELTLLDTVDSTFEVTWNVSVEDVHNQIEIDFRLTSVEPPHRYGSYDDGVQLMYRVLPVI